MIISFYRLTGVYAIIIGAHATLLKYFEYGILKNLTVLVRYYCEHHSWANFLYINNIQYRNQQVRKKTLLCQPRRMIFFRSSRYPIYFLGVRTGPVD